MHDKLTGKKLNVDRQFFKDVLCIILLQEGVGQYQFSGKIATHFPHFHWLTLPLKWRFLYIPPTPFYYNPRPCLPTAFLINNIYSCKSIINLLVQILSALLLTKSLWTKLKNYLLEAPYRFNETSQLELFTKMVNGL